MLSRVEYAYRPPAETRHAGRFVFVVSHMRSFSSLLCHILGSHPEISGYAESHLSYFGRLDLQRLARKVQRVTDNAALGRYVLDKILHNQREIAPGVLVRPELKLIFLLRNPEDTMQSILNLSRIRGAKNKFDDPVRVLDYYIGRLKQLEHYCAHLGSNALFLESERLIGDTDRVLAELSGWLELREPLKASYRTFRFTGAPGFGDPSTTILAGTVVRSDEDRHRHYVPIPISDEVLRRGIDAHATCRSGLAKYGVAV